MRKSLGILLICVGVFVSSFSMVRLIAKDQLIVAKSSYDSIKILNSQIANLQDSISVLNQRPVMTSAQFIKIYKYERLEKYYKLCTKKPSQWKYYKGWSSRVFKQ